MAKEYGLTADELAEAERVIRRAPAGLYTLKKLYGDDWNSKASPTTFGARFAASIVAKRLSGIALHSEKTRANALQYRVDGR